MNKCVCMHVCVFVCMYLWLCVCVCLCVGYVCEGCCEALDVTGSQRVSSGEDDVHEQGSRKVRDPLTPR